MIKDRQNELFDNMIYFFKYKKIRFLIILIFLNVFILKIINKLSSDKIQKSKLANEIEKIYNTFQKVNINEVDNNINKRIEYNRHINSTINIGVTLENNYVFETMITIASIMGTQKNNTKIRLHFGVTNNFTIENMLKIYELKQRINNLTEFNFYYLKESVIKMKGFHPKGECIPGKFELPLYLSDDIERLLFFDVGDLLVLRDLTDLYNYEMGQFWIIGTPEPSIINSFMKLEYNITKYLNAGSLLLNVKLLKQNNFWENFTKNRYIKLRGAPDQTLFNIIIPDDKKNYIPFKFGGFSLFSSDNNYDSLIYDDFKFKSWFNSKLSLSLPDNPKSESGIILNLYNPSFIHQFYGKWKDGKGLSIYRLLAKYFILLTGISDEICTKKPGYCI